MSTVQITQEQDGPSDTIVTVYLESDGSSGELVAQTILDPATLLNPNTNTIGLPKTNMFNIQEVYYFLDGFDVIVQFGGDVPMKRLTLVPSVDSYVDFRRIGGLADKNPAQNNPNGKMQINTSGFASAGGFGTLIFKVRKMNK